MKRKILLLDADSLIYICSVKDTLSECISEFDIRFDKILKSTEATEYIGYITYGNCFRYMISSTYKYKRKFSDSPKWLKALKEYTITQYGFRGHHGLEADDLVGLAKTYYNNLKIDNIIGSIDKDVLKQIPGTHFNYKFDKDTEDFAGEVHTTPDEAIRFLFLQVLMGDSTDGIQGLKGVGEVKANKYLDDNPINTSELESKDVLSDYIKLVLDIYGTYYSPIRALKHFTESFRLVYILRTKEDYEYEMDNPLLTDDIFDSIILVQTEIKW